MVKVGHFCVVAAASADMCAAFVAPGPAAAGLVASQHARVLVSARSHSSDTFRQQREESRRGPYRRRQQLGLQVCMLAM